MTCGSNCDCVLCQSAAKVKTPWGWRVLPREPSAYEGEGNLTSEMQTGKHSHTPRIRLCRGCLERVLSKA